MKSNVRTLALAASLGLALPAQADPIEAKGAVPPSLDALQSLAREMAQGDDPKLPLRSKLERLERFQPTPATADKLRAAFGTARPILFERQPDQAGRSAWRATLLPQHLSSASGFSIDWDTAIVDLTLDRSGTMLDSSGSWNSISATDGNTHFTVRGTTLSGHQRLGNGGLWYGSMQMRVAAVRVEPKTGMPALTMDDLRFEASTVEHPTSVDVRYDSRIGAIGVAGERVEDVHFALHVANLDKQVLAEFKAASERRRAQAGAPAPAPGQPDPMTPVLRSFARSAQARGTFIEIEDFSARYHGNRATLHGRIGLGKGGAGLDDFKALARRVIARFEIKVPLAIVRDVAGAVAAKQSPAQQANPAAAQTITDVIVGKLVGGGYARVENDALVSTIEWRDGMLRANGKQVALPDMSGVKPSSPTSQTVTAGASLDLPAAPLAPDALRPRRIDASCRLPDYPAEVVSRNQPLRLVLSYRIGADGKVLDPAIASPSRFPAWDSAALAALAQCAYIPALQGGKPVEVPMRWTIQREPGTARP